MFVGQMEQEAESLEFCENLVSGKIEDWARFVDVGQDGLGSDLDYKSEVNLFLSTNQLRKYLWEQIKNKLKSGKY